MEFNDNVYTKFPYLFHKYILKITNPSNPIEYIDIKKNSYLSGSKYFLHIHCFNIELLDLYFSTIIQNYKTIFNIIITYCEGINTPIDIPNSVLLKIVNKGADIGAKLTMINYLQFITRS